MDIMGRPEDYASRCPSWSARWLGNTWMPRLFEHRCALLVAAGAAWAACGAPGAARAAPLSSADFRALAARCAPAVPSETLEAVARTESGLDPWALHDNTTGLSVKAGSLGAALADARQWIGRGDSVDLGLMQINSASLSALGMTIPAALDPCASLAGGAAVLQAAYAGGKTSAEQQAALLMALSRYNTGSPFKGIMDGYARRVIAAADAGASPRMPHTAPVTAATSAGKPPSWNVWAMAAYVRIHGAPWLVALTPARTPSPGDRILPAGRPVTASPAASVVATNQGRMSTHPTSRSQ